MSSAHYEDNCPPNSPWTDASRAAVRDPRLNTPAELAERKADDLFRMGRQAESFGQREAAASLYRKVIAKYPETGAAKKAAAKLKKWGM